MEIEKEAVDRTARQHSCCKRVCGWDVSPRTALPLQTATLATVYTALTYPLWNLAVRPRSVGGGKPVVAALSLIPSIGVAIFYVFQMWNRAWPELVSRPTFVRYAAAVIGAAMVMRVINGIVTPVNVEDQITPPDSATGYFVTNCLYLVVFHVFVLWIPTIVYTSRSVQLTRGVKLTPWTFSRSRVAGAVAFTIATYTVTAQMMDGAGGPNLLIFSPISLVMWLMMLVWTRKQHLVRDSAYLMILGQATVGIPIAIGNFMLSLIVTTRGNEFGQVIVVLGFNVMIGVTYAAWRITSSTAIGGTDLARPYDFLFILVLELFSEIIFIEIVVRSCARQTELVRDWRVVWLPSSHTLFFARWFKDLVVHVELAGRVAKSLTNRVWMQGRDGVTAANSEVRSLHQSFHRLEVVLLADLCATMLVVTMIVMEYVSIDLGFGIQLLTIATAQYGRLPVLASYAIIFVSQLGSATLARRSIRARLLAVRDAGASRPSQGGAVDVTENPLHSHKRGIEGQARLPTRRESVLSGAAGWSPSSSLDEFWQRHWLHFATVSVFSIGFTIRFVLDIKAVALGELLDAGKNATD